MSGTRLICPGPLALCPHPRLFTPCPLLERTAPHFSEAKPAAAEDVVAAPWWAAAVVSSVDGFQGREAEVHHALRLPLFECAGPTDINVPVVSKAVP